MDVGHLHDVDAAVGEPRDALGGQRLHGDERLGLGRRAVVRGYVAGGGGVGGGLPGGRHPFLVQVRLDVLGQVVTAHEALGTLRTGELLLTWGVLQKERLVDYQLLAKLTPQVATFRVSLLNIFYFLW